MGRPILFKKRFLSIGPLLKRDKNSSRPPHTSCRIRNNPLLVILECNSFVVRGEGGRSQYGFGISWQTIFTLGMHIPSHNGNPQYNMLL